MSSETRYRPATHLPRAAPFRVRHRVQFPPPSGETPDQDEAFFTLVDDNGDRRVRFHDYAAIYDHPGLYEQLFYDRLKCQSPGKVAETLQASVAKEETPLSELRVLDLGAGNGMVGEALATRGVARMVGVDIIPEARDAAYRDRPGLYDGYYVCDLTDLDDGVRHDLETWNFNCLITVAALGFGDIPPEAFREALNLVEPGGWIAFNIRDTFLDESDTSGFSRMIRELILSEYLDVYHLERYRHRLSIDGQPLFYFAIVVRKVGGDIPEDLLPR